MSSWVTAGRTSAGVFRTGPIGVYPLLAYLNGILKCFAVWVPYVAVLIGMYLFHSAWTALLLYHTGILVIIRQRRPSNLWKTVWAGAKNPWTGPAVAAGALAAPTVYFLWPLLHLSENVLPLWMAKYGLTGWPWLLLIPYFSLVHPVLEEIHWRGIAPERFIPLCRQDLFFAGYHVLVLCQLVHWPWLILVFSVLVGSSIVWRWTANRFEGCLLPILSHAAADAGVLVGVLFLLKG